MNVDKIISDALQARANQVTEADLTPAEVPARGPRRARWVAPLLAAATVAAVATTAAIVANQPSALHRVQPGGSGDINRRVSRPAGPLSRYLSHAITNMRTVGSGSPSATAVGSAAHGTPVPCYFVDATPCPVSSG